jgi:uncharacterized protein with PQ loop repeat
MKNIEIDSDKYTVIGVLFLFLLMLMSLISDVHDLERHSIKLPAGVLWNFAAAIFIAWGAISIVRDSKLREAYPYGTLGFCVLGFVFLARLIPRSLMPSSGTLDLIWRTLTLLDIAGCTLLLAESVRWFKKRLRLI